MTNKKAQAYLLSVAARRRRRSVGAEERTKGVTWVAPRWSLSSARIDTYSGGSPPHLPRRCWCAKVPVRIQGGVYAAAACIWVVRGTVCVRYVRVYGPRCACAAERTREA